MARGKSIELFFIDGHTDGMKAATIPFQWSGHVLVASRTQLKDLLKPCHIIFNGPEHYAMKRLPVAFNNHVV